ncbi:hypothetical protein, partial [Achromobacter marplatensis]|uniref:hypothetical protein n=1 Tax=Achromobacter marplatensis TaxID=470868 RepID=UPI00131EEB5E
LLNSLLLLAELACFAVAFALRRLLFSAAERRDYEGVFIACQVSFVHFRATAFLLATPSDPLSLAVIETSEAPVRVNPKFSATAKPETITQLLQIMQPAFA